MALTAEVLGWVLRRSQRAPSTPNGLTFAAWKKIVDAQVRPRFQADTFAQAVASGAVADRLAYAFAGGYQSALRWADV